MSAAPSVQQSAPILGQPLKSSFQLSAAEMKEIEEVIESLQIVKPSATVTEQKEIEAVIESLQLLII